MVEQLEHIPFKELKMMHCKHYGLQMIENHSMDRMVILVVEIDVGGMTADVVDKLTCSSDDVQPRQVDLSYKFAPLKRESIQELRVYLKLFQFDIVDIHIVQEQ
nr:hypothetical protein [Tanacetum cinerariifolium]